MTDETTQRLDDAEKHRESYDAIMGFACKVGVSLAMGLTMMCTSFVMANGVIVSVLAGIATYVFVNIVVKLFFSH